MKAIPAAVAAALILTGCTTTSFLAGVDRARAVIKAVNSGVMAVDEAARDLCPSLPTAERVAQGLACAAKANGTTQAGISKGAAAWRAFCERPAAGTLLAKGAEITAIINAVTTAQAAGCFAP